MAKKVKNFRTDKKSDSTRKAKPSGYRYNVGNDKDHPLYYKRPTASEIKKHLAGEGKWKDKIYFEGRPERSDKNQTSKLEKGGNVNVENLDKELRKLQRDLNSSRLQTYIEGDNSEEAIALKKEREVKLSRFNEVLKLLREKDAKYKKGGEMGLGGALKNIFKKKKSQPRMEFLLEVFKDEKLSNSMRFNNKLSADNVADDYKKIGYTTKIREVEYKMKKGGTIKNNKEDKFYKVSVNKNMEAEFLSILKENNISDYNFVGYENHEGLEVAVYEVYVKSMDELEVIKRNASTLAPQYKQGGEFYKDGGNLWIQVAVEHKGALRRKAKEMGLIHGEEPLSENDLEQIEKLGGVWNRRVELARTLKSFHKEEGGELDNQFGKGGKINNSKKLLAESRMREIAKILGGDKHEGSDEEKIPYISGQPLAWYYKKNDHSVKVPVEYESELDSLSEIINKYEKGGKIAVDSHGKEVVVIDADKMTTEDIIKNELKESGKIKASFLRTLLGGHALDYHVTIGNIKLRKPHLHSYYVEIN